MRQTRKFLVKDWGFLIEAMVIASKRLNIKSAQYDRDPEAYLKKNFDAVLNKLGDDLIFSIDGEKAITPRVIEVHFTAVVNKAEISNADSRGLVPYSFRHHFITQRVNAGLDLMTIAEMCGTSPTQIQNTYYHTTKEKMRSNALADYSIVDGVIVKQ